MCAVGERLSITVSYFQLRVRVSACAHVKISLYHGSPVSS